VVYCSDLGAHIDGFSAVVAHTLVIGASKVCPILLFVSCFCVVFSLGAVCYVFMKSYVGCYV